MGPEQHSPGLIWCHYKSETFCILHPGPMRISVWLVACHHQVPLGDLSPASGSVLVHRHGSALYWILKGDPLRSLGFSLCSALCSLVMCPMNSTALVSLNSQLHLLILGNLLGSTKVILPCAMALFQSTVSPSESCDGMLGLHVSS